MTEKPPVLNARLKHAIEQNYPLYWAGELDSYRITLRAVTYTYENGRERTSLMAWTYELDYARRLDAHLRQIGHAPTNSHVLNEIADRRAA